jgi:hypothetical protein
MSVNRRDVLVALGALPLLATRPAAASVSSPALKALLVGIDDYSYARRLTRAVGDALSVSAKLQSYGYDVSVLANSTAEELASQVDAFVSRLRPEDSVFFFFSGHGVQAAGESYLVPRDAGNENLYQASLRLGTLLERIGSAQPKQSVVILDACRDNPEVGSVAASPGLASIAAPSRFFVAFSAGAGETALDNLGPGDDSENSVFTRVLLGQLAPDKPVDSIIRETRSRVVRLAQSIGHSQTPAIYDQSPQPLRLDGTPDYSSATAVTSVSAEIKDTRALIVAVTGYSDDIRDHLLPGAGHDSLYIGDALTQLSVPTNIISNPSKPQFLKAVRDFSSFDGRKLLYLAGVGTFDGADAAFHVRTDSPFPKFYEEETAVRIGELVGILCSSDQPCLLLLDMGLERIDDIFTDGSGGRTRGAAIPAIKSDFLASFAREPSKRPTLGILSSCNFFQSAADLDVQGVNSPFAIALDNALARPNLTFEALTDLVRQEVEVMTSGRQTPIMLAGDSMRSHILVGAR